MISLKWKIRIKKWLGRKLSLRQISYTYIKNNYHILEAGAHVGWDTQVLATLTNAEVYAFEPVKSIYEQLQSNVKDFKNVHTYRIALSSKNGSTEMYISSGGSDGSSSLLKPKDHLETNPEVAFSEVEIVETLTLDQWAENNKVKAIEYMWLDMQGMEFEVLKNSPKIFSTVKVIFTEISTRELYEGHGIYSDFKTWLINNGFKLKGEDLSWDFTGDALFIRK